MKNMICISNDLILKVLLGKDMPFCYHCGKSVEEDWIVCPFCTKSTQGSNSQHGINLQDSAVSEISTTNVTNTNIIDNSVKINEQTCPGCQATGNIHPRLCNCTINDVKCTNYYCELCKVTQNLFYLMCLDCAKKCDVKVCNKCGKEHSRHKKKCENPCGSKSFTSPKIHAQRNF